MNVSTCYADFAKGGRGPPTKRVGIPRVGERGPGTPTKRATERVGEIEKASNYGISSWLVIDLWSELLKTVDK